MKLIFYLTGAFTVTDYLQMPSALETFCHLVSIFGLAATPYEAYWSDMGLCHLLQ